MSVNQGNFPAQRPNSFLTLDIKGCVIAAVREHVQQKIAELDGSKERLLEQAAIETAELRGREDNDHVRDQMLHQNETLNEKVRALRDLADRVQTFGIPMYWVQEGAFMAMEELPQRDRSTMGGFYFLLASDKKGHGCGGEQIFVPHFGRITILSLSAPRAQALCGKKAPDSADESEHPVKKFVKIER